MLIFNLFVYINDYLARVKQLPSVAISSSTNVTIADATAGSDEDDLQTRLQALRN